MNKIITASLIFSFLFLLTTCRAAAPIKPTALPSPNPPTHELANAVRVGVLVTRSAVATNAQYGSIIAYLQQTLHRPVTLVPLEPETQFISVSEQDLDFIFTHPLAATQLRRINQIEFLATLSRQNTGSDLSGLIIVNSKSNITTVNELKGARGACISFQTAVSCVAQIHYLQQHGLNPFTDFSSFVETPSQDNIALGVLNGTFDVGFIRTGQIEKMVSEGLLTSLHEVRIINPVQDDFYYAHTTPLYPEWAFAALPQTDPALKAQVQQALLEITPDQPLTSEGEDIWFVPARDYKSLDDLIISLKLRSWDVILPTE